MTKRRAEGFRAFMAKVTQPVDLTPPTGVEEVRDKWAEAVWVRLSGRDQVAVALALVEYGVVDAAAATVRRKTHWWANQIWRAMPIGARFDVAITIEARRSRREALLAKLQELAP